MTRASRTTLWANTASWRFELEVALRYFRSSRHDAMIGLLCRITAGGLALGVAALILALAALSGFQQRLLGEVLSRTPQLQIAVSDRVDLARLREIVVGVEGVRDQQVVLYGVGWLPHAGEVTSVELIGFEKRVPDWLPGLESWSEGGLVLPRDKLVRWRLEAGDVVEVVSPRSTLTPLGPQPRSRRLPVSGVHDPGTADERFAERVALPLHLARSLVGNGDQWLDLELLPNADVREVTTELVAALDEASVTVPAIRSWRDLNRALLFVLRLEKTAVFLAVALIVLVASFALVAALSLILASKRSEVGILAAMGTTPRRIRRVFLWLGGLLAVGGTLAGALLGVVIAWTLETFRLVPLPGEVYIVDHVPFVVRGIDLAIVLLAAFAVTLLAAMNGSRRAAALQPVEALKK